MTKQEKIRAEIIAAQAQREEANRPPGKPRSKPRANWAASPPLAPSRRSQRRPIPDRR
jgi:hypothetical protein